MKKFIKTLYQSFYSKEFYAEAAHSWKGTGIKLLGGLSLLLAIAFLLPLFFIIPDDYTAVKKEFVEQVPQVTIENGALSIDKTTPYTIGFEREEKLILIDTSEAANKLSLEEILLQMKQQNIRAFVTKTQVVTLKSESESRVYSLSEFKEKVVFGKKDVYEIANVLEVIIFPFLLVLMFLFIWVYKIIQMLLYSIPAMLINSILGTKLEYISLMRITTCAIFPITLIGLALIVFASDLPFFLSFIGTIVFIFFGIKAAKQTAKPY